MELRPLEQAVSIDFETKIDRAKQSAERSKKAGNDREDAELMRVAKEFESIFLSIMYKEMKKTVGESGLVEKSNGTRIFEDMYMDELSKMNVSQSGMGIAKMLYDQFKFSRRNAVPVEEAMKSEE